MLLAGARTVINTSEPPNDQIFAGKHHDLRMTPDISETEKVRNFTGFHPEDATGRKTCCQGATGTDVTCRSRNKSVQLAAVGQQKSKAGLGEVNFRFPIGFEGETGWNIPKHPKTSRNPWIPWFLAPTWVFPAEKHHHLQAPVDLCPKGRPRHTGAVAWTSSVGIIIPQFCICLVVYQPLWKIWIRQFGSWNSQLNGKKCSKPPTSYSCWTDLKPQSSYPPVPKSSWFTARDDSWVPVPSSIP